jgi:outer membrane murein-binding lipoprotein Lpp
MTAIPSRGEPGFSPGRPLIDRPSHTRRASRALLRYLVAILIGVAGTLAWQSYGEAAKQLVAVNAPQLGWSPETQQMIAGWVQELGLTKPPAAAENTALPTVAVDTPQSAAVPQTAPAAPPQAPAAPSLAQVQQMAADLATLHQTVDQLTAGRDQMARDIANLQAANDAILQKISAPPPQIAAPPERKHMSGAPPLPPR